MMFLGLLIGAIIGFINGDGDSALIYGLIGLGISLGFKGLIFLIGLIAMFFNR